MSEWKINLKNDRHCIYCFPQIVREFIYVALLNWIHEPQGQDGERARVLGERTISIAMGLSTSIPGGFDEIAQCLSAIVEAFKDNWPKRALPFVEVRNRFNDKFYGDRIPYLGILFEDARTYVSSAKIEDPSPFSEELEWLHKNCIQLSAMENILQSSLPHLHRKYYQLGMSLSFIRYGFLLPNDVKSEREAIAKIKSLSTEAPFCLMRMHPTIPWSSLDEAELLEDSYEQHLKLCSFETEMGIAFDPPTNQFSTLDSEKHRLAYELLLDTGTSISDSLLELNILMEQQAKQFGPKVKYKECKSDQSMRDWANAYASSHGLPSPPKREKGRSRKQVDPNRDP